MRDACLCMSLRTCPCVHVCVYVYLCGCVLFALHRSTFVSVDRHVYAHTNTKTPPISVRSCPLFSSQELEQIYTLVCSDFKNPSPSPHLSIYPPHGHLPLPSLAYPPPLSSPTTFFNTQIQQITQSKKEADPNEDSETPLPPLPSANSENIRPSKVNGTSNTLPRDHSGEIYCGKSGREYGGRRRGRDVERKGRRGGGLGVYGEAKGGKGLLGRAGVSSSSEEKEEEKQTGEGGEGGEEEKEEEDDEFGSESDGETPGEIHKCVYTQARIQHDTLQRPNNPQAPTFPSPFLPSLSALSTLSRSLPSLAALSPFPFHCFAWHSDTKFPCPHWACHSFSLLHRPLDPLPCPPAPPPQKRRCRPRTPAISESKVRREE